MTIDYDKLMRWPVPEIEQRYTERDTILYALGVGYGHDPLDRRQLRFVYEQGLQAAPTYPVVLGYPGFWMKDPGTGIDWVKILHGEQSLTIHRPIPPTGHVVGRTRVTAIVDKGKDKGALVIQERAITNVATSELLATAAAVIVCRGDGGFGGGDIAPPPKPAPPDTAPEFICDLPTLPQAALIYRLSGDYNPLHADPEVATKAGFQRPILHGLGTYGVAGHALLRTFCEYDPTRLRELSLRFSAPVFPGETIRTEMWRRDDRVLFRARVLERGIVVLNNGSALIG